MTPRKSDDERREHGDGATFAGYAPGKEMPLGAYAGLAGIYGLGLGAALIRLDRNDRLPARMGAGDGILLGLATHKLTRIVTRDWVTSPLRAPFVQYQRPAPGGEVEEKPRGKGLRRAIGDLITCPFCMGPWVAGSLMLGLSVKPRATRLLMGIFASVAASDFLHRSYGLLESMRQESEAATEQLAAVSQASASPSETSAHPGAVEDAHVVDEG